FKEYFYDWPGDKPEKMVGKHRAAGDPLLPWTGELSPLSLVPVVAERLNIFFPEEGLLEKARALTQTPPKIVNVPGATRTPYFCSGCPHNTSTKLPEGSRAAAGIGCHVMASWMDRDTVGYAQMGGEGVPHVAASKFNGGKHIFQNLGEGTWYHSGSLAIRQAVAANANITYKILYNDAVAMTGGQPVDGPVSVHGIAQTCRAEGVDRIALVSDNIAKFKRADFPAGTTFHPREELDTVQRALRDIPGVTVLIYEQVCATEKRRRRKRGKMEDPNRFAYINPAVCEGCGDCSVESNCLSIEPLETEFGRKRKVNLSSCNKDFSCLNGFCPSFVTVEGERRRKTGKDIDIAALVAGLPVPDLPGLDTPFELLVTGVGGTGVVTVGALITMAAHLEGKGASVLDFTGFAQKFGTVLSYIRLGARPEAINQVRIDHGSADAVIGCDIVASSAPRASAMYRVGTRCVVNMAEMPTGDLVLHRDATLNVAARYASIQAAVGRENVDGFDTNQLAERIMGDTVFANVILLGYAWQKGLVPVSEVALKQAILLNAVAVENNVRAFDLGRVMAVKPEILVDDTDHPAPDLGQIIARNVAYLTAYQNAGYAARYRTAINGFQAALPSGISDELTEIAAGVLFKLMAIKDEYEVARLHTAPEFASLLSAEFEPGFKLTYHFAAPLLSWKRDARGRPLKRGFGPWMTRGLRLLARLKFLRGTAFDPFGHMAERKEEIGLIGWYLGIMQTLAGTATPENAKTVKQALAAPYEIRGYGPVKSAEIEKTKERVRAMVMGT
ncbi:MAG: indolepyruvate ferredoxin oxidoreductase family protein, partial [Rhodobacter sp.]|nr:indolepyruvate ferredoxin oxidoreductase family protein [Rhodobacter sp.]